MVVAATVVVDGRSSIFDSMTGALLAHANSKKARLTPMSIFFIVFSPLKNFTLQL
jgi:hypothetical protein